MIYPEYDTKESILYNGSLRPSVINLWDKLPIFRDSMKNVPTLHVPINKEVIKLALKNSDFMVATKTFANYYWYKL